MLLASQQVRVEEDLMFELDALDCVRLPDQSVLVRHRDGRYELLPGAARSELEVVGGEDAGSVLTDLALPEDFPRDISTMLQNICNRLGVSPAVSIEELLPRLAELRGRDLKLSLCLVYGELVRARIGGQWLGLVYPAGVEPALVARSAGIVHYAGHLLRLATKRELPAVEVFTRLIHS